ncbi:hypothetical protein [Xanthomonas sp. 1678]|uniref:hypothetical protein n=1 Tax=Xanthomonas sp. 1678 TaxID=3158788 RepID=UPI002855F44B|nr:hypothetical protein [Xanthomonas translucens]
MIDLVGWGSVAMVVASASASASAEATATAKAGARSRAFAPVGASHFCLGKSNQNRSRPTRAGAIQPHRSPALLATSGTAPKLASLKQGRLFGRSSLRCSARFKAGKVKIKITGNGNGNGNGKSKSKSSSKSKSKSKSKSSSCCGGKGAGVFAFCFGVGWVMRGLGCVSG